MSVKKLKKKHRLKRLNAVPKKRNLDQNVNDTKCNIWNSFLIFLRILFRAHNFFYSSIRSGGHHQSFFLVSDFLAESLKASQKSF